MFAGVGIIGALASILASLLVPPPKQPTTSRRRRRRAEPAPTAAMLAERRRPLRAEVSGAARSCAQLQAEVRALREAMPGKPGQDTKRRPRANPRTASRRWDGRPDAAGGPVHVERLLDLGGVEVP